MEHLEKNSYYAKYADRVKKLQQTSPAEFQAKLDALEAAKQVERSQREADLREAETEAAVAARERASRLGLDAIMDVERIREKTPEEITELWKFYHENKDYIFAVIPANEYAEMQRKAKEFPNFLYPLPRNEGYEYFVQRWSGDTCHFTPLIAFQAHRENTQTCLSLTHYTELLEDRGIVLMNGQPDPRVLSIYEAQLLALQVKLYYGICAGLKFNHVRHFNNSPQTFHHEQLIREFENYKKDARDKKEGTF
jgi:ATP synthase F1 complex assembly factor 1